MLLYISIHLFILKLSFVCFSNGGYHKRFPHIEHGYAINDKRSYLNYHFTRRGLNSIFFVSYLYQNDFSVAYKSYMYAFRLPDMDEWCKWENMLTLRKSKQIKKLFESNFLICFFSLKDHDDVIKWEHFPRYWPFVWGIHRSPVNSPHKGQCRGALIFSFICAWING